LLLLLISVTAAAQDSARVEKQDSSRWKKFIPTGVRFGTDALAIARTSYDDTFEGWEVNADADFGRFYLAVDYGNWGRTHAYEKNDENGFYTNDGSYWRAGIDVNFLTKDPEKNMFFIGARYGRSTFSEHLTFNRADTLWGPINADLKNLNIKASWFELTTGIRVKIWKMIWMGYTARFKFGLNMPEDGELVPHDVPGYGSTDKESTWGFNYQVFIRIPVRKQPVPLSQKK
jgi:hypothetical protein